MSHETIIERWLDTLEGRTDARGRPLQNYRGGANVYGEGDTLYSYGRHFPLCEHYPAGRGRRRALFLLNGDRVSSSTSRHQDDTRGAVLRRAHPNGSANPVADVLIVPFSALAAAGILHPTILPLEIRPDRWETIAERPVPAGIDLQDVSTAHETRTEPVPDYRPLGMRDETRPDMTVYVWRAEGYLFQRRDYNTGDGPGRPWVLDNPRGEPRELDGYHRLYSQRHLLGDSLFTAETVERRRILRPVSVRDVVWAGVQDARASRHGTRGLELDRLDVDAPIVETVDVRRRRRYVSSFDVNEPAPLYFLATLPSSSRAQTVASAIDDLAPAAVHAAIARGRHVERQGDIFAIETDVHDAALAGYPRARLTLETRGARPRPSEPGYAAPFTAEECRRIVRRARALWRKRWADLSTSYAARLRPGNARDYDRRRGATRVASLERQLADARARARRAVLTFEPGRNYAGYWAARELGRARESVGYVERELFAARLARGAGRDHYRRGCSIQPQATALQLWRDCYRDAQHELRPELRPDAVDRRRRETRAILSIHGTAHTATEVVRAPGGRVYIRGAMVHSPAIVGENRERDHIRRPLKPGVWYLAVRNTVPRASADTNGRR